TMNPRDYTDLLRQMQAKLSTTDLGAYGVIPIERVDEFINLVVDDSALLKVVHTQVVDNRAGEFVYFDLPGHVVVAAPAEGTEPAAGWTDTGSISVGKAFEYTCKKLATHFALTWETINWNLTGPEFEDFLVRQWSRAVRRDLEILAIQGDTSSTDPFLKLDDGWLKIIESAHTGPLQGHTINWVDNNGNPKPVDPTLVQVAYKVFIQDPVARMIAPNPVWIANPVVYADYMHYLSSRQDALGAAALMGGGDLRPDGVPVLNGAKGVPYMPVTSSGGALVTKVLLGDPDQLWFVVHREFRLEQVRNPRRDAWEWYGHAYVDFVVPFPRAFVLITNIIVG
ncbi:MAG: phage major capsid protein, partial [Candidatus Bipolaricaulaceae bacterium]